jgi:hypothetical protein
MNLRAIEDVRAGRVVERCGDGVRHARFPRRSWLDRLLRRPAPRPMLLGLTLHDARAGDLVRVQTSGVVEVQVQR